jgi:hypothetical protein
MKGFRFYSALLLTVVFSVALMPFNIFHQHEVDEHRLAVLTHQKDHYCELDKHICKDETVSTCGHEHHISEPIPKCFSCQFHVEKIFDAVPVVCFHLFLQESASHYSYVTLTASVALERASNKGPPLAC